MNDEKEQTKNPLALEPVVKAVEEWKASVDAAGGKGSVLMIATDRKIDGALIIGSPMDLTGVIATQLKGDDIVGAIIRMAVALADVRDEDKTTTDK